MTSEYDKTDNNSDDEKTRAQAFAIEKVKMLAEIERLKAELKESKLTERDAARFKPEFLADMSHELKTPMNAIVGLTDLLRRSPLNREQLKLVEIIQHSGRVLLDVINDVLTFSLLESGEFDLQTQVFEIVRVVEGAAQSLSVKAREKNIALTTFISPELPGLLIGDPHRIRQVFLNLIGAVIDVSEAGKLSVRLTRAAKDDSIYLTAQLSVEICFSPQVVLADGDTSGANNIKIDASSSHSDTALVREVTRRLIEFMGGTIAFESSLTKFLLTLPEAPTSKQFEQSKLSNLKSRILLGNLSAPDRELLLEYARAYGTSCDVAFSNELIIEFLNQAEQQARPYHLLILDLQQYLKSSCREQIDGATLGEFSRKDLELAIIRPYDEVGAVEALFETQIARPLTRPLNQTQFLSCLNDSINYKIDSSTNENETAFEDSLLTNREFDLSQRVLVVEDNQVNREVVKLQLKTLGIKPFLVTGGVQALKELESNHFDFIFMDCQMPKMDGY